MVAKSKIQEKHNEEDYFVFCVFCSTVRPGGGMGPDLYAKPDICRLTEVESGFAVGFVVAWKPSLAPVADGQYLS
ncbi:hypothetical protein [Ferrovum myxofaciens]|uniref:Uncharacterized protein n=1 Tax=Ferrovum myxofaciens TaxID=416213 RepID=A0A9E6N074_9PROT|nr:hypothetical protein [Ferrovum myxofaciens]QSH81932.1 MAG: hypothetical protein HO273_13890 [Ferrovum myxofaciens]QWY78270.1 MAG: hypothetical protein JZL65_04130 [Ferrovum myxofaciens]